MNSEICDITQFINEKQEEEIQFDISRIKFPKTTSEMFGEIPLDLMKTDDHPICRLVNKAETSNSHLFGLLDEISDFFRKSNDIDLFPQKKILNSSQQITQSHFDGVFSPPKK